MEFSSHTGILGYLSPSALRGLFRSVAMVTLADQTCPKDKSIVQYTFLRDMPQSIQRHKYIRDTELLPLKWGLVSC